MTLQSERAFSQRRFHLRDMFLEEGPHIALAQHLRIENHVHAGVLRIRGNPQDALVPDVFGIGLVLSWLLFWWLGVHRDGIACHNSRAGWKQ